MTFTPVSTLAQSLYAGAQVHSNIFFATSFITGNSPCAFYGASVPLSPHVANEALGPFYLSLCDDANGSPGNILRILEGDSFPATFAVYTYTNSAPLELATNTTYWLVGSSPESVSSAYFWYEAANENTDPGSIWAMGKTRYGIDSDWFSNSFFPMFSITVIPQPPLLSISDTVPITVSFSINEFPFTLEQNTNLLTSDWIAVANTNIVNDQVILTVQPTAPAMFYRVNLSQ